MAPIGKLYYFSGRGRGEGARYLLAQVSADVILRCQQASTSIVRAWRALALYHMHCDELLDQCTLRRAYIRRSDSLRMRALVADVGVIFKRRYIALWQ